MSTLHRGRRSMYSLQYQLVWCVKNRQDVLDADVSARLMGYLLKYAEDNEITILDYTLYTDHIEVVVDCTPQHHIPDFIKGMKGVSARLLLKDCPSLKDQLWTDQLWSPNYFVSIVSTEVGAQVETYLAAQKKKQPTPASVVLKK